MICPVSHPPVRSGARGGSGAGLTPGETSVTVVTEAGNGETGRMAFRFKPSARDLGAELRRVAADQVRRARRAASDDASDPHEAVHDLRKRCKKLRGLIRLVRPGFTDYGQENAAIRDFARSLSGLRDLEALVETHDALMRDVGDEKHRFAPVRAQLTRARSAVDVRIGDTHRAQLEALATRIADWRVEGDPAKVLEKGLALTWKRAARAHEKALAAPTVAVMHEWRKRAKYHWHHCCLLERGWPAQMAPRAAEAKRLSDLLGDHHDLALYMEYLGSGNAPRLEPEASRALSAHVDRRIGTLEREAFALGARFFAEKPAAAAKRIVAWWEIARREG